MADDDTFVVGAPLPRIAAVLPQDGFRVVVTWASDGPGASVQVVDLAPAMFRYKLYAPLRDDAALFRTVRVTDDGFALAWGDGDDLDMASTTLAELAEQAMTPADFGAFMKRNGYTLDSVAAELGISRRLAAYYAKDREIPRTVALACRFLDKSGNQNVAALASASMLTSYPAGPVRGHVYVSAPGMSGDLLRRLSERVAYSGTSFVPMAQAVMAEEDEEGEAQRAWIYQGQGR